MMRFISRVLIGVMLLSGANIPWEAMAAAPSGGGNATSLWSKIILTNIAGTGVADFSVALTQLKAAEAKAFDAMVAEKPYLMKSQLLYSMFIERVLAIGLYDHLIKSPTSPLQNLSQTVEPKKGMTSKPVALGLGDLTPASPSQNKAAYTSGTLEKLGLPKEAYDDALLYKIVLAMETAGQQLKTMTEQRKTAEAKVNTVLASLQTSAKTDNEKITALGSDAIVHIRRFTGWPMRTIIPDLQKNPECAGDLFKDQSLFAYLDARVGNSKKGIVDGNLALFTVLKCADLVQTGSLDSGITLEWIRLHEVFADPKFDLARNRVREWLFGMALMVGDVHQTIGITGTQALVQLAGDTRLVGPGSWLVRDGVNFYNTGSGVLNHFVINEEAYVPKPPPPPPPPAVSKMDMSFKSTALDIPVKLNQAVIDTQKQIEQGTKVIKLSDIKPLEFLDLTTPFGFTFRELQGSCTFHPAIQPVVQAPAGVRPVGGVPGYSITDFITLSAPDRVGMGLCSKKEMLITGGYCKRIVCEPPELFFAQPEPPLDGSVPGGAVCNLPMPGLMSQCELGQQISQEIHALATSNGGCPVNPWMEGKETPPPPPPPPPTEEEKKEEQKKKEEEQKKKDAADAIKPPSECSNCTLIHADATGQVWEAPNGDWFIVVCVGGAPCMAVPSNAGSGNGGGSSSGASSSSSSPATRPAATPETPAAGGGRPGSGGGAGAGPGTGTRDPSGTAGKGQKEDGYKPAMGAGGGAVGLPGDSKSHVTDPNAKGGDKPKKQEPGLLEKFFGMFSGKGSALGKILGKTKIKGAAKSMNMFGEVGSNCQFSKDPAFCEIIEAYQEAHMASKAAVENLAKEKGLLGVAGFYGAYMPDAMLDLMDGMISDIKTFDDVERLMRLLVYLNVQTQKMETITPSGDVSLDGLTDDEKHQRAGMKAFEDLLQMKLQDSDMFQLYKNHIVKRAIEVLNSPQFNGVAKSAFATCFGVSQGPHFNAKFDAALEKAIGKSHKITGFDYKKTDAVLGRAHRGGGGWIELQVGTSAFEADHYKKLPIRDIMVRTQIHEVLHHVSFDLEADGYHDLPFVVDETLFDRADHAAMYMISMSLKVSIELESARKLGPGYTSFDHLFYDGDVYAPPVKNNPGKGSGSSSGSASGSSGSGATKDCPPGAPCGGCQMTSHKASMAAKCNGALAIKNPLTPIIKPSPIDGSGTPANDAYQTFMNCVYPGSGSKGAPSSNCFAIVCSEANSTHECCAGKAKADPAAVNLSNFFIKTCGTVKCVEGSTNPCCPQSAAKRGVNSPLRSAPSPIDTRQYVPYQEPRGTGRAPPAR